MSDLLNSPDPIAVVLAAGKGTRMNSERPKVLMPACGRPLIDYVIDALDAAGITRKLIVVGYRADEVKMALASRENLTFVEQTEQLGTGHAVMVCQDHLTDHQGPVVVVTGDSPMIQSSSLASLLDSFQFEQPSCLLGTLIKDDPRGLGRIIRDVEGRFRGIVEEKDATPQERAVQEVNMSTYVFEGPALLESLAHLSNRNSQREYYLTDCPAILMSMGRKVDALPVLKPCEALSVNNLDELAAVEIELKRIGVS